MYQQSGSTILIVLLAMTGVLLLCMRTSMGSSLIADIVVKKQEHEQFFRLTEGLLLYGINLCKQEYETIKVAQQNLFIGHASSWPDSQSLYAGHLEIIKNINESFAIDARLQKKGESCDCYRLCCTVEQQVADDGISFFSISAWRHHHGVHEL